MPIDPPNTPPTEPEKKAAAADAEPAKTADARSKFGGISALDIGRDSQYDGGHDNPFNG